MAKFREAAIALDRKRMPHSWRILTPEQRERLDQIQLQAQGPFAFARPDGATEAHVGPPLAERLKLSDDQARRARAICRSKERRRSRRRPASRSSSIRRTGRRPWRRFGKLVESPEFQAAKQKAAQAGRDASAAVIRRIEEVLTAEQREAYHKLLGEPFDLSKLRIRRARTGRAADR